MSKKNHNEQPSSVADRQMDQALSELGGRETPPNRLDEILQKASADAAGEAPVLSRPAGKLWAAAILLLGLTATITASLLKGDEAASNQQVQAGAGDQEQLGNQQAPKIQDPSIQDPKPKPKRRKPAEGQGKQDPKKKAKKDLPKGTDPEDLKVLRSAEKMLEAEKNLKEMIKKGRIAGVDQVLPFHEISAWKYTDGLKGMPKKVKAIDGKKVLMLGFMLPIDEVQNIKEFLLVESLWSCCYGQPPDINGIVRCVMPKDKRLDYQFDPLKLVGKMKVEATMMDGYCVDIYQLHVDYIEVLDGASPDTNDKPGQKGKPDKKGKPVKKGAGK